MNAHARVLPGLVITIAVVACAAADGPTENPAAPIEPAPPSTGGFLFKTRTTGSNPDPDGYRIVISPANAAGSYEFAIGTNDSILISHQQLAPFTSFRIQLHGVASNCWPPLVSGMLAAVVWNVVTPFEFRLDCMASGYLIEYDRVTPHHANSIAFHGSLSEQYVFSSDGRFRLRYTSARFGAFEYAGRYGHTSATVMGLDFDGDVEWEAVGTLSGDSLSVTYDDFMLHSDFEPGIFVRRRVSASRRE